MTLVSESSVSNAVLTLPPARIRQQPIRLEHATLQAMAAAPVTFVPRVKLGSQGMEVSA
jgi:hypothetical protein